MKCGPLTVSWTLVRVAPTPAQGHHAAERRVHGLAMVLALALALVLVLVLVLGSGNCALRLRAITIG